MAGNFIATGVFVSLRAVVRGQGDAASAVQAELCFLTKGSVAKYLLIKHAARSVG